MKQKTIQGNILDITKGIICHQVNCKGVAGTGLALQIRNKYPEWYKKYKSREHLSLGYVGWNYISKNLTICDLYAQDKYGRDKRHTNYAALARCLWALRGLEGIKTYLPYGIGCGAGGGDWNIVREIIFDALPHAIIIKWDSEL